MAIDVERQGSLTTGSTRLYGSRL